MKFVIILLIFLFSYMNALCASAAERPFIAKWYKNYKAAVSLRFDDAHVSHVNVVIPLLNQYDIKGTFMINPGRSRYRKYRDVWEKEVPQMGHRLGNHTMRHWGAKDLEEAEYEIGALSRIIWDLYPQESKLLVFASGGGKKWDGEYWHSASSEYKEIVRKYHMIDLYDGKHPSVRGDATTSGEQLCGYIDNAIQENTHQAFTFHNVGEKDFIEWAKAFVRGYDLSISTYEFENFIQCIDKLKNEVWVAPLSDILKYEEEFQGARVTSLTSNSTSYTLVLEVKTDPSLYDHKLTMVLPVKQGMTVKRVIQDNEAHQVYKRTQGKSLVDIEAVDSKITIIFAKISKRL